MLTIDRKLNQSVYINDLKVKVTDIKKSERSVVLKIDDAKEIRIKSSQSTEIGESEVYLIKVISINKVRLGFEGDMDVKVLREELYHNDNQLKYVDNATKQFPSGDF